MECFVLMLLGISCLFAVTSAQGFISNRVLSELPGPQNQFRRQHNVQQHHQFLSDGQQNNQPFNHQQQHPYYNQQLARDEVSSQSQQSKHRQQNVRFPLAPPQPQPQPQPPLVAQAPVHQHQHQNQLRSTAQTNYVTQQQPQQSNQFPRSLHNHLQVQSHQQQQLQQPLATQASSYLPENDLHTQNFLTLRTYDHQNGGGIGGSQRQQFQQPQQQQYQPIASGPTFTSSAVDPQFQNSFRPTQIIPDKPFSTVPQFSFNQQPKPLPQQQFQSPSNLGLPVPRLPFPPVQSTAAFPQHQPNPQFEQHYSQQQPQQHQQHQQHQQQQQQQQQLFPAPSQQPISPDQEYKQKLIQKHEQFVQKQYEKSQNKVKQLHEDFIQKQQSIRNVVPSQQQYQPIDEHGLPPRSRPVYQPSELQQFAAALKKYHEDHPTTTTTTTTTTTPEPPPPAPSSTSKSALANRNIYAQVKAELGKYGTKTSSSKSGAKPVRTISREDLLKQLRAALAETPQKELTNKTYHEMDLVLPNGQRVQVIRTTDPNLVKGQKGFSQDQLQELIESDSQKRPKSPPGLESVAPDSEHDLVLSNGHKVKISRAPNPDAALPEGVDLSNLASIYGGGSNAVGGTNSIASSAVIESDEPPSLEELAKRGLIPDGYEIEGLSSKSKPKRTQPVLPKKKATYVYLEEQADGSFKIQGVKANGEKETKQTGTEVESILSRIRSGDIKLPPSVQRLTLPNDEVFDIKSGKVVQVTPAQTTTTTTTTTTPPPPPPPPPSTEANQYPQHRFSHSTTHRPTHYNPSPYSTTITPLHHRPSTVHYIESSSTAAPPRPTSLPSPSPPPAVTTAIPATERLTRVDQQSAQESEPIPAAALQQTASSSSNPSEDLIQILKSRGLFAMAKYLKQSGLDAILNETGPYTIFVPTDKAFKNLLIQLGGPERAEEKFKSSPRLLSGLLLHHVIPGSFEISSLQDEMTGVSLAGTQLRVNQYTMHDQEWNDVLLTTINGAMVVPDKKDIKIPQGIAQAVDRVMFPLPVGDLLQTLQSDRENRFTNFLKILYISGLSDKLQSKGIKTYTVFAPTDKGFRDVDSDTLQKLFTDKEAAEEFAMKHIVPGTLFSAGMRFYQVKDSLSTGKTVILQKTSSGKIKVNETQMVTSNIPATNGVIHALDGLLS